MKPPEDRIKLSYIRVLSQIRVISHSRVQFQIRVLSQIRVQSQTRVMSQIRVFTVDIKEHGDAREDLNDRSPVVDHVRDLQKIES